TSHGGVESSYSPHGQGTAPTLLTQTTTWEGNQLLYVNGAQEQSDAVTTLTKIEENEVKPTTSKFTVGGQCNTPINYDFDGSIAELIIYQVDVSETTRKSIESFLALKYGIPLPHEYTDYYGTTIFNDATYNNSVIGLAREDLNYLKQRQSTNIYNIGAAGNLTLSTGAITEYDHRNVATDIAVNSSYFVCGHNGQPAESGRIYKAQTTNFDQQVTVQFNFSELTEVPNLYVSSDGSFTSPTEVIADSYTDGKLVYTHTFDDNATQYFKIDDIAIPSPGGVSDSLQMWLTATEIADTTHNHPVASWTDYTGNLGDAVSTNLASPTFLHSATDNINYNPTVSFDGTDDGLDFGSSFFDAPTSNDGITLFAVAAPSETVTENQLIFDVGLNPTNGLGISYGYEDASFYTATTDGGAEQTFIHTHKTTPSIIAGTAIFSDKQYISLNGRPLIEDAITLAKFEEGAEFTHSPTHVANAGPITIGTSSATGGGGNYFSGKIAEVIAYNKPLTDIETQKVESYLALKHGISLNKSYINSEGTITWNHTTNTGYNNDITGIGKNDISLLDQKQSHNSFGTDIVAIGAGGIESTNEANPTTLDNLSSLIWGHNDSTIIAIEHINKPSTVEGRIGRVWKVQETNDVGNVEIRFTLSNHGSVTAGDLVLMVDTDKDGAFEDTDSIYTTAQNDGDDYYFSDIDLNSGELFTLGSIDTAQTPLRPTISSKPGVGINTEAIHKTAQLHIEATDKGVLLPTLTNNEINAITNPPTGLIVFNIDEKRYSYNAGTPHTPQWKFIGRVNITNSTALKTETGAYNGEIRYNTSTNTLWYWDGTLWQELQDE
ncbi:MAG: hypothetical protein R6U95_03445, partial [Bacteroidales bacterium]